MTQIATVILTSSPLTQSRLVRTLSAAPEIRLCGQAGELSGAYVLIEQKEPKLGHPGVRAVAPSGFRRPSGDVPRHGHHGMRIASDSQPGEAAAQAPVLDPALPAPAMLAQIRAALAGAGAGGPTQAAAPARVAGCVAGPARPFHPDWQFNRRNSTRCCGCCRRFRRLPAHRDRAAHRGGLFRQPDPTSGPRLRGLGGA